MAEIGGGKYDDAANLARLTTEAQFLILLVIGGNRGEGFSIQTTDVRYLKSAPGMLREIANQIEKDLQ
jgi:hypothetical protein